MNTTRPMYWSVQRELWENRSVYIAPLLVVAVFLFGFVISTIGMPQRRPATLKLSAEKQRAAIGQPYDVAAIALTITSFIVGLFYCLDALHGERRDRSILFWKSMPVSDLTTVLSKASIPLVVLPVLIFAVVVVTQFLMLLWSSVVLLPSGLAATTWSRFNLFKESWILLYGLIAVTLWHAPIYGCLLLVSAWARRATFLWAVLPFVAISVVEKIAFNTLHFFSLLKYRFMGYLPFAFAVKPDGKFDFTQLTPGRFLSMPGLWMGLVVTAAFIGAAVRLRRNREPI